MSDDPALGFGTDPFEVMFGQLTGPVHWPSLTAREHADRMAELRAWVEQLVVRFSLEPRTVPPCWPRHRGMVEMLSALRDFERAAYADTASPTAAVDWLRALREVQHLLVETVAKTQCTIHDHRDDPPVTWLHPTIAAKTVPNTTGTTRNPQSPTTSFR